MSPCSLLATTSPALAKLNNGEAYYGGALLSLASLTTLDMCRSKTPPVPLSELFLSAPKSDSCCWLRAESQALFLSDLKPQSCPASELFLFWHAGEASLGSSQGGGKRHLLPPMTLNDTRPRCHGPLIEID